MAVQQPLPPTAPVVPAFTPATQTQKITLCVCLLISTALILSCWCEVLNRLEAQFKAEHTVQWTAPAMVALKPGPPMFTYDSGRHLLAYKGVIDAQSKTELLSLLIVEGTDNATQVTQGYADAIGHLAYSASESGARTICYLLLLGGLSAMLGVQLRSIVNCVNVICYKKALDTPLWWPWYAMRPLAGFLIGFTVVVLVKAEVLFKGEAAAGGSLWWAGLALLAGFGASEFTDRLRLLSRTLFGEGEGRPDHTT